MSVSCLHNTYECSLFFSALNRVLEPTVLMELKLSDGKIHTCEVCDLSFCMGK